MSDLPWETVLEKDALKVWKMTVPDCQFVFIKAIAAIDASRLQASGQLDNEMLLYSCVSSPVT
jgi:hypothetical protein